MNPKHNKTKLKETKKKRKSNKTNRHKHRSKIKTVSSAPQMRPLVSFCTVHRYTHKQDWINMRPQDRAILITQ